MPSFDVVSEVDMHEIDNAVQQASKEVSTRFDFRGTDTEIERSDDGIMLRSNSEGRLEAALGVLHEKLVKRGVSLKSLDAQSPQPAAKGTYRQLVKLEQGVSQEKAKEMVKFLKGTKLKVQGSIQQDRVRVTGKKKDDLQEAIAALKEKDFDLPLQFVNFRD